MEFPAISQTETPFLCEMYNLIVERIDTEGYFEFPVKRLAVNFDVSKTRVRSALTQLEKRGIIRKGKSQGRTPAKHKLLSNPVPPIPPNSKKEASSRDTPVPPVSNSSSKPCSPKSLKIPTLDKNAPTLVTNSPPYFLLYWGGNNNNIIYCFMDKKQATGETQPFFKKTGGELIPRRSMEEATTTEEKVLVVGKEYQTKNPGGLFSPKNIMNELNLSFGEVAEILTQLLASKKVFQYQPGGWGVV